MLAPYFPPTDLRTFTNAHRVFGAGNITKLLQVNTPTSRFTVHRLHLCREYIVDNHDAMVFELMPPDSTRSSDLVKDGRIDRKSRSGRGRTRRAAWRTRRMPG